MDGLYYLWFVVSYEILTISKKDCDEWTDKSQHDAIMYFFETALSQFDDKILARKVLPENEKLGATWKDLLEGGIKKDNDLQTALKFCNAFETELKQNKEFV